MLAWNRAAIRPHPPHVERKNSDTRGVILQQLTNEHLKEKAASQSIQKRLTLNGVLSPH